MLFARAIFSIYENRFALWVGLPAPALFGARGGLGEEALHSETRGGEHSSPCLPIPPKELNVKSNVDCIRMQPSIRWIISENVDCSREAELLAYIAQRPVSDVQWYQAVLCFR